MNSPRSEPLRVSKSAGMVGALISVSCQGIKIMRSKTM